MLVRLLRMSDGGAGETFSESLLQVDRLTIGSDAGQALQLPFPDVAARHAIIQPQGSTLRIEACARARVRVNGRRKTIAFLRTGDTIQVGAATLEMREADPRVTVIVEVREAAPRRSLRMAAHQALTLRAAGLGVRFWAWALVLAVLGILLIPQLAASFHPDIRSIVQSGGWGGGMKAWQPGPLHSSHQFIQKCDTCHAAPLARVPDERCTQCHGSIQHHVAARSRGRALFAGLRCGSCHVEHLQRASLAPRDARLCTDCHAGLRSKVPGTSLQDVSDFANRHPDIAARLPPREMSNLQFSHAVHLDPKGIKASNGYEVLGCQSCHEPNASGRQMLPIHMERHCARCHSLQFDEHDPRKTVPHGSVQGVLDALQAQFIREYLAGGDRPAGEQGRAARRPGGEAGIMSRDEQRRARDWAERQSLTIGGELISRRVCVQCHRVSRDDRGWHVAQVRLRDTWMPMARFDHAAHRATECALCHANALKSRSSQDVLMPRIGTCRTCHGGASESGRVESDCGMCHRFHLPGRGAFDGPVQARE
ncbi:MAG: cytochrome c3 family protein [Steroidobacteraceae bacterium]